MTMLSDSALARLRTLACEPDFSETPYELREVVGLGGMGIVYRAVDKRLDREVAIKMLAPHLHGENFSAYLRDESRAIARLEHPGIVPVHDVGQLATGEDYYVMKLVRGVRLDQRLMTASRGEALRWFVRICDAVAFAHTQGVVHRDLKPQNVMLGAFGEVLVLDWGVAAMPGESSPGIVAGTPGFMAPEQSAGDAADVRSDVYALGKILAQIVRSTAGEEPAPLASIVAMATADQIGQRYESVSELSTDIVAFLDRAPVRAHRETLVERMARIAARHRFPVFIILTYLLVRLVLLVALDR